MKKLYKALKKLEQEREAKEQRELELMREQQELEEIEALREEIEATKAEQASARQYQAQLAAAEKSAAAHEQKLNRYYHELTPNERASLTPAEQIAWVQHDLQRDAEAHQKATEAAGLTAPAPVPLQPWVKLADAPTTNPTTENVE